MRMSEVNAAIKRKKEEKLMSGKNGDRSRFNRQRKAKMHDRTRIREMRKLLQAPKANTTEKAQ
jgi:hypothetical protein